MFVIVFVLKLILSEMFSCRGSNNMMLSFQYLTSSQDKKKDKAIEVSPPQTLTEGERERDRQNRNVNDKKHIGTQRS